MNTQEKEENLTFDDEKTQTQNRKVSVKYQEPISKEDVISAFDTINEVKTFIEKNRLTTLDQLLTKINNPVSKSSFLVFKNKKYITISIENIAFFNVRKECTFIECFDGQEFTISYSLDHAQKLLSEDQFFRLNRQYLINFSAIKEVEYYFARKLLVRLAVPTPEKLVVSKERSANFLKWLEDR
jgi:two-component system, LytTR family, response regulator LytT